MRPDSKERRSLLYELVLFAAAALAVAIFAAYEMGAPVRGGGDATSNIVSFFLVNLNIVLVLVVTFMVGRNLTKLVVERRRGVLGSQLASRLAFGFVAVAFFPGVLMVVFSYGFVTNSIDGWLSDDIEHALDGAWGVAHRYYRDVADDSISHARALSSAISREGTLAGVSDTQLRELIVAQQSAYGLGAVQVVDLDGVQRLVVAGQGVQAGLPRGPGAELLAQALSGRAEAEVEGVGEGDVIRGAAPIIEGSGTVVGAVVVDAWVERSAKREADTILEAFREFRQLRLGKRPLKNLYALTLGLAALVVVLAAIWLGIIMARTITDPIGRLAAATRDVASGRWDVELIEGGGDEVATLVTAFNSMTAELKRSHEDLEARGAYTQNVLANIDAGVISVGDSARIETINPAACELLGVEVATALDRDANEVFEEADMSAAAVLLGDLRGGR
ncbi:MAG: two-component system nitrogen regulation sensor histidine kinase NtrY, partial [Hyphomicrobiaceae bacterium]